MYGLERLYLANESSHKGHSSNPQVVCLGQLSIELREVDNCNHGLGNTNDEQVIGIGVEPARSKEVILRCCMPL